MIPFRMCDPPSGSLLPKSEYEALTRAPQVYFDPIDASDIVVPVRNYFPETWYWALVDAETTQLTVPDLATTWVVNAICVNDKLGIGVLDPLTVQSTKRFLIDYRLPKSLTVGEVINVKLQLYVLIEADCFMLESEIEVTEGIRINGEAKRRACFCPNEENNPITFTLKGFS